jgi:hypothetical protein
MKKLAIFFLFFPIYLFAQTTNLPKIESLTGDTISGKYNDIVWNYDNLNRVRSMVNRNCFLPKTISNPTGRLLIDTMQIQYFKYSDNQLQPFLRIVNSYEYDRIEFDNSNSNKEPLEYKPSRAELKLEWRDSVFHYYNYQNSKRKSDSVIYHSKRCCDENSIELKEGIVRIKQTNSSMETEFFDKLKYGERDKLHYKDSMVYGKNIQNVLTYSLDWANRISNSLLSTYSKFDNAINPLHHLNISSSLSEGKISFEKIDLNNILNDFNLDDGVFQWYYINENNPIAIEIERGKTDLPYKDKMLLSYTYNEYKLPISCNAQITKYFSNGEFAGKYQKRFTFRYMK